MNTISLKSRRLSLVADISKIEDESIVSKIEAYVKKLSKTPKRFSIEEYEARIQKAEKSHQEGRILTKEDVKKRLGF